MVDGEAALSRESFGKGAGCGKHGDGFCLNCLCMRQSLMALLPEAM